MTGMLAFKNDRENPVSDLGQRAFSNSKGKIASYGLRKLNGIIEAPKTRNTILHDNLVRKITEPAVLVAAEVEDTNALNAKELLDRFNLRWRQTKLRQERSNLKKRIQDIGRNAAEKNWDGEGAEAVSELAVENALKIASCLPADIEDPETYAGSDGEIDFDWENQERELLTFSFHSDGETAWSAELKEFSSRGIFRRLDGLPCLLECCLRHFHGPQFHGPQS